MSQTNNQTLKLLNSLKSYGANTIKKRSPSLQPKQHNKSTIPQLIEKHTSMKLFNYDRQLAQMVTKASEYIVESETRKPPKTNILNDYLAQLHRCQTELSEIIEKYILVAPQQIDEETNVLLGKAFKCVVFANVIYEKITKQQFTA
jgi:hypothetical protein